MPGSSLADFPLYCACFFLCIIGYNWILGIVWNCSSVPCHGLALNPTFAISRSFRGIFYITSVMCCTFRFAWLGISLRCSLSRSFVCTSFHTNEKSGKPQCFGLAIFYLFVRFDLISCFLFLFPDSSHNCCCICSVHESKV